MASFRFFKIVAICHFEFVMRMYAYVWATRRVFGGVSCSAKFGWNWLCNFENMRVSVLCEFCLSMPIHAPLWQFLGLKWGKWNFLQFYTSRNAITRE